MTAATATTNHEVIRKWADARGGKPARVRDTAEGAGGVLRIDFAPEDNSLEPIGWDRFFAIFEEQKLAFLHQDLTETGETSRFNELIVRDKTNEN